MEFSEFKKRNILTMIVVFFLLTAGMSNTVIQQDLIFKLLYYHGVDGVCVCNIQRVKVQYWEIWEVGLIS